MVVITGAQILEGVNLSDFLSFGDPVAVRNFDGTELIFSNGKVRDNMQIEGRPGERNNICVLPPYFYFNVSNYTASILITPLHKKRVDFTPCDEDGAKPFSKVCVVGTSIIITGKDVLSNNFYSEKFDSLLFAEKAFFVNVKNKYFSLDKDVCNYCTSLFQKINPELKLSSEKLTGQQITQYKKENYPVSIGDFIIKHGKDEEPFSFFKIQSGSFFMLPYSKQEAFLEKAFCSQKK